jgi:hypothetical protein
MHIKFWSVNIKEDLRISVRIILKLILEKLNVKAWTIQVA